MNWDIWVQSLYKLVQIFFLVAVQTLSIVTSKKKLEALELSIARCCIIVALAVGWAMADFHPGQQLDLLSKKGAENSAISEWEQQSCLSPRSCTRAQFVYVHIGRRNYMYCYECIQVYINVGSQWLARQRKIKQELSQHTTVTKSKSDVCNQKLE